MGVVDGEGTGEGEGGEEILADGLARGKVDTEGGARGP